MHAATFIFAFLNDAMDCETVYGSGRLNVECLFNLHCAHQQSGVFFSERVVPANKNESEKIAVQDCGKEFSIVT